MSRYKDDEKSIKERAKKYGCNGKCYTNGICPIVDTCEETRVKEFGATLFAILCLILGYIIVGAFILFTIVTFIKAIINTFGG